MSKVEQSSEKASAAKKNKVDTDNLDLGGETPIERMDIVLPGQDDIGQGVGHINQQPLEGGVGRQASPQSHVNAPTEQDFAFSNASDANTPDINAPASTNNANQGRSAQIQDIPSIDGVDAVQSGSAAPLAPELNSLSQENRAEGADGQKDPSSISQTTTGSEDASEINVAPVDIDFSNTEVAENASGGTVIATLSTVDANDTDTHTYEIVSDPSGYFEIVGDEIRVKDGADLDFETAPIHEISIQVTDSSGNTFTETMTIDLTDVNEYDVSSISDTDTSTNTISEDVSNGDSVGITASATDADGSNNTVTYSLSDDAGGIFEIDASTGEVSIADASGIDYENATSHTIEVTATSADGSTSTQNYTIDVSDVDEFDVTAVSDTDNAANTIAEDVSNGDRVGITATATDADGSNNAVTYSLSDDAAGIFEIDASTGEVSIADASGIDYENATSHTIEVTATSADGSTSTQNYTIDVSDVDEFDVGAVTDTDSNTNTLAENASAGDEIGVTASATDADGTNNTVTYSVDDARFEVASDGTVTVASGASFDAETEGSIDIEVTATSADGSTSTETFSINVSDIDEFDVGAVSDSNASSNAVDEDASVGDTVGITALASDGDVTDGVTYSLSDDAGGLFDIDANTGVVTVAGSLDAETSTSHTIEVTATSDDGSTSTQIFAIGVNDVNETSITAISDSDASGNTVTEGASVGTAVGITAFASDADATDTVSYSLSSNPGGFFAIDANTGEVTVAASLDYETDTAHTIEVTATSTDGTTSTQTFTIGVADEDEHDVGVISDTDGSANTIAEDVANGDGVGVTASASDADGTNNAVTYSLSDDAGGIFEIDANTGEVSIADASGIDYENATSHTIEVTATSADGSTSTQNYTIDVSDVDEFDVGAVTDTDSATNTIAENASNGDSVGITASATDADGSNNTVTYSLSDDVGGIFEIDANTGEVSIADASGIDYENATSHTIEVTATSADGSTSTQNYTIDVSDVDEFDVSAVSDTDSAANTIAEDVANGDSVGITASATDADGSNNTVTYSLSDDASGIFEIDANTGEVSILDASGIDYETATSHTIEVTATSADGSTSTQNYTIDVSDVDEFDVGAVTDTDSNTNTLAENASAGDEIGVTASATDADGTNNTVTYSVDDARFEVASDGTVTVASGASFDAETEGSIDIEVTATSADGSTSTETFSINVSDIDEFDVGAVSDSNASSNAVDENASVGDTVGITALASDGDVTDGVTYSLSDDAGGLFDIDANTGVVTVAGSLDAETSTSHTIEVTATSDDGSTSTQTFAIGVNDVNETSITAISDTDGTGNTVTEGASVGTAVGITALASDADATDTVSYSLSSNPGGFFAIDANTGEVTVAGSLDYETDTAHTIEVTATSADGSTSTQTFAIAVGDEAENVQLADGGVTFTDTGVTETSVSGGTGDDNITGTSGDDVIAGNSGNDVVNAGVGNDKFDDSASGNGDDTVNMGAGDDYAYGGDGSDVIDGGTGEDFIHGEDGNDTLTGGADDDTIRGGDGVDIAVFSGDRADYTISHSESPYYDGGVWTVTGPDGTDTVMEIETFRFDDGDYSAADLQETADQTIVGTVNDDVLNGGSGNDTISGLAGDDVVNAGAGDDRFDDTSTGNGNDTLNMGEGNDTAYGGDGTDTINGDEGNDTLYGESGDDRIEGGEGDDRIDGGADDDTVVFSGNWADYTITESGGTYTVVDNRPGSPDGTDTVRNVEFFEFADGTTTADDVIDVGPSDIDLSATSIDENSSAGTVVATLSAEDNSLDVQSYTITNDPSGFFEISGDQVVVKAGADFDFENATSHDITIEVSDGAGSTYTETITINVADVDEFDVGAVTDTDSAANTIAENASAGDEVGVTASASDADGTNNTVTYSVDDVRFEVASDGTVTVASGASFDAETEGSIDIEVTATSADGSTSTETFSINVSDIDEFDVGAVSDSNAATNGVDEDASIGDTVGITALATDGDVTDGVTYSLTDDAGGLFDIDANTGVVTVAGSLDAETSTSHTIEVTATSDDGSISTQTFAIGVNDVNETSITAISDTDGTGNTVTEGASVGTAVGITALASDADATDTVSYSLSSNPGGFFAIDANTGEVTVAGLLDYETDTSHTIEVTATSSDGSTSTETFSINVSDIDEFDVGSISDTDGSANTIAEDVSNGDSVGITASASDGDVTDGVTYSLSDDAGGIFEIDANTGEVSIADASGIDYETATSHTIEVTATSADGSTSTQNYTINVTDVDEFDVSVVSDTDGATNTIAEYASAGDEVGVTVSASDADGTNNTVTYSVDDARFEVAADGTVTVASGASFDAETEGSIDIEVTATSADGSTSTETFSINVSDIDEFDVGVVSDSNASSNAVDENASVGDTVGITALASDGDVTDGVSYSLSDDAGGLFDIDANTGVVTVAGSLDAETSTSHTIEVTATSDDGSTSTQIFAIGVNDVNETSITAISDSDASGNTVTEGASVGTAVGITAFASDADATDTVSYSLSSNPGGFFAIDANTGEVTVAASLDYETDTSHTIEVTATSTDGTTSTQTFTIGVADEDEHDVSAISDTDGSANSVDENAASGTTVGIIASASDADATNSDVTYSLSDDAGGLFTIDATTGEVTTTAALDAETASSYDIEVTATSDDGSTSVTTFTVDVNNLMDEGPTDITFTGGTVNETVLDGGTIDSAYDPSGSTVATLSATDADAGDSFTYSITSDPSGHFEIVGNEVRVKSGQTIDFETAETHDITIEVTDAGGNTYSETITINVQDFEGSATGTSSNESFTGSSEEDAIDGGNGNDTIYGGDGDDTIDGGYGSDTIYGGAGDDVIYEGSDGQNAGVLYGEEGNDTLYTGGGTGDDQLYGGEGDDTLIDLGSSDSLWDWDGSTGNDLLDGGAGNDDLQGGLGQERLIGGEGNDTIDGGDDTDTAVYSGNWSDYTITESGGTYTIVDNRSGSPDGTDTVTNVENFEFADGTVAVADLLDVGPSDIDVSSNSVDENSTSGTVVATLSTTDNALDSHSYEITNDPSGFFEVSGDQIVVKAGADIDYEDATSHDITVEVTDAGGNTYSETVTINVADVNEAPTDITFSGNSDLDITGGNPTSVDAVVTGEIVSSGSNSSIDHFEISHNGGELTIDGLADGLNGGDLDMQFELLRDNGDGTYTSVGYNDDGASGSDGSTSSLDSYLNFSDLEAGDYLLAVGNINFDQTDVENTSSDYPTGYWNGSSETGEYQVTISGDATVAIAQNPDFGGTWGDPQNNISIVNDGSSPATIAAGSVIGSAESVSDVDAGETFTYALADDADGKFDIDADTGEITLVAEHDASSAYSDTVDVQVTDSGGNTYTETVGIQLGTVGNDAILGTTGSDIIHGFDGADYIDGNGGDDSVSAGGGVSSENLIVNGSFEADDVGAAQQSTSFDGWTASSGSIEIGDESHSAYGGVNASDGEQFVEMNAGTDFDSFYQDVATNDGEIYNLSLDVALRGNGYGTAGDDGVEVYWNGELVDTIEPGSNSMETYTFEVVGTGGDDRLEFAEPGGTNGGASVLFDNVSLVSSGDFVTTGSGDDTLVAGDGTPGEVEELTLNDTGTDAVASVSNFLSADIDEISFEVNLSVDNIPSSGATIVSYATMDGSSMHDDEFSIVLQADGSLDITINQGSSINTGSLTTDLTDGSEHRLSVTWDNTDGGIKVYIDGVEEYSVTGVATSGMIDGGGTLILGQEQDSVGGSFDTSEIFSGTMDDVRVFNDVRTATEIADNHDSQLSDPSSTSNLVANWQFDGESGSTVTDLANNYDLTLSGDASLETGPIEGGTLEGGSGNDTLTGGTGNDTLDGGTGKDTLDGGAGDDILMAGFDDGTGDIFIGGEGNDTYQIEGTNVENHAFNIDLNTGSDQYDNSYSGIENINGGNGDDTFTGDANANTFSGGAGDDTMYGGDESDIFVFGEGDGADTVHGGAGGGWTDTIELSDAGGDLGTYGTDWTVSLTSGSIDAQDANSLTLSDDADGTITLADGSTVDFFEIERIEF